MFWGEKLAKGTLSMPKRLIGEVIQAFNQGDDKLLPELVSRKKELTSEDVVKVFVACKSKTSRRIFWPVVVHMGRKIDNEGMTAIMISDSNGNSLGHYGRQAKHILECRANDKQKEQQQLRGRKALRPAGVAA